MIDVRSFISQLRPFQNGKNTRDFELISFSGLVFCHHSHVDTNSEMQSLSPGQANTLYPRPACFQLFHCDRLGQVAGLIGISALGQCRMIGEQLRGDGVDDGGQKIGGCGHRDLCPGALGRCL